MSQEHNGAGVSLETFQGIIRERREESKEKTSLKRLRDLNRIRDMKSRQGVDPIEIFPKEIWQLILDELSPEDRGNMWNLHEMFRDLMEKSHVRDNLFPQILKLDVPEFWKPPDSDDPDEDEDEEEVDDEDMEKAPLAHYLELRRVSKSLRNGIDLFLEEDLLNVLRQQDAHNKPGRTLHFIFRGSPINVEKIDRALAFIGTDPKSKPPPRFISRSITVKIEAYRVVNDAYVELFAQFVKKLTQFLEAVGDQILHFSLEALDYATGARRNQKKVILPLGEWTMLMKNLKWLQFYCYCESKSNCGFDMQNQNRQWQKIENLERMDFFLQVGSQSELGAESLCEAILSANPQIKYLGISGKGHKAALALASPEAVDLRTEDSFFKIKNGLNPNWPLKRMTLLFDMNNNSLHAVFKFLEKFPSLEKLSLKMKNVVIGGGLDFLRLSNLQEFELDINPKVVFTAPIHFFFSLQFLLYSKNLKQITWNNDLRDVERLRGLLKQKEESGNGNMIDFGGGWEILTESNIWQVFPNLEYVKVSLNDDYESRSVREYRRGEMVSEEFMPYLEY